MNEQQMGRKLLSYIIVDSSMRSNFVDVFITSEQQYVSCLWCLFLHCYVTHEPKQEVSTSTLRHS